MINLKNINTEKLLKPALIVVASVAFLSIVFWFFEEKSVRDYDDITSLGRIRVLTDNSSIGFRVDGDSVYGFQYEIVKAFAARAGVELEISENDDSRESMEELMAGEYDIVAAMLPQTSDYVDKVLFTIPLQVNRQMLVQRKDSAGLVTKQFDLAGDTISLPRNSPYKMLIDHLSDDIADTIYTAELKNTTTDVAVKMVADGIIRYTICSERMSKKMMLNYPQLDISVPVGFQQENVWMVNKKATMLQKKLNEFLTDFIGSSEYWELYRKYY